MHDIRIIFCDLPTSEAALQQVAVRTQKLFVFRTTWFSTYMWQDAKESNISRLLWKIWGSGMECLSLPHIITLFFGTTLVVHHIQSGEPWVTRYGKSCTHLHIYNIVGSSWDEWKNSTHSMLLLQMLSLPPMRPNPNQLKLKVSREQVVETQRAFEALGILRKRRSRDKRSSLQCSPLDYTGIKFVDHSIGRRLTTSSLLKWKRFMHYIDDDTNSTFSGYRVYGRSIGTKIQCKFNVGVDFVRYRKSRNRRSLLLLKWKRRAWRATRAQHIIP